MGAATGILVAQNLGAGQPGRAEKHGWVSVGMEEIFMMTVGVGVLIWAENIVGIFNTDPGLVVIASAFLRISVASFIVVGVAACLQHSISSVGDTLPPMLVTVLTQWVVVLPLALFLSRSTDLGMYGVRWAIVIGTFVRAITFATYFRMGRWKRKKI